MLEVKRKPRHPGELIQRQYLEPLGMTIAELAAILGVSLEELAQIVAGTAGVTPEVALRLGVALQTTPDLWLNLQQGYDLWWAANRSQDWKKIQPIAQLGG